MQRMLSERMVRLFLKVSRFKQSEGNRVQRIPLVFGVWQRKLGVKHDFHWQVRGRSRRSSR